MSSNNLNRYIKEVLKLEPRTLSISQMEILIEYDAWLDSAAELLRAPAEPEQTCPVCFGDRERLNNDGLMHKCEFCDGTGKSNRSGRG